MKKTIPYEALLIERLKAGDATAFTVLYDQYFEPLNMFVLKYVKSAQLSEDIVQEIFLKIWNGREQLNEIKSFKAWLFTVARNQTLNVLKKVANESAGMGEVLRNYRYEQNPVENKILEKEYGQEIENILNSLPPKTREVFRLCREEEKSYEEVSALLGISRNAVKKHIVRSHKVFRDNLRGKLKMTIGMLLNLIY